MAANIRKAPPAVGGVNTHFFRKTPSVSFGDMIVHLRNQGTKLYYAGKGRWVAGPPLQLRFNSIPEALLFSRQERLSNMEVVLLHSDSMHKVVLPVGIPAVEPEHSNYGMYRSVARAA